MGPDHLRRLIQGLAPDLAGLREPWTIIGSAALLVAGLPVEDCPDLDILTTEAGAAALEARWAAWREADYAPDPAAAFRSRFSRYRMPEGAVEVMGDLRLRTAAGWTAVEARAVERRAFAGVEVRVPTPVEQLRILRSFGRPKDLAKAVRLEAFLAAG
ncbi:hypothetical protein [Phenylobacterium sp.]|uniref:hypothetical protein n=1 Tax=Phenylobacterium sp. TaxID=1871053 RepID=UPI0039564EB7